jgi:hypothetical protein
MTKIKSPLRGALWAAGLTILVGLTLLTAIAWLSPFHPGAGPLYRVQRALEDGVLMLRSTPAGQAGQSIHLAERRLADLAALQGQPNEPLALFELQQALRSALAAVSRSPQSAAGDLREPIQAVFEQASALLARLNPADPLEAYSLRLLQEWVALTLQRLRQPGLQLSDLGLLVTNAPAADLEPGVVQAGGLPTETAGTPTPHPVSPHSVIFPPGSPGARHAFYPLIGRHGAIDCAACHPQGIYAGTTTDCATCHRDQLPAAHFPGACDTCHAPTAWSDIHFTHSLPQAADCAGCHQRARPASHYPGQCSACHTTAAWLPASFDHAVAGATDCLSCHTGNRPANHWGGQCSACHSTASWLPATFNHAAAGATDCLSCHVASRPANHWTAQCSACHSTNAWRPASFNHAAAGATDCIGCHSGNRPANHYDGQCSTCHSTNAWRPANFNHSFPMNHGNANGQCSSCHPGGGSAWTCFTCHNQGEMDHKHFEKGILDYASRCLECHPGGRDADD